LGIAEPLALELQGARGNQLLAYRRTPIARVPGRRQRSVRHRLDMDLDVDTVEQWPRDALLVFAHLLGRAAALAARVAEPAAAASCRERVYILLVVEVVICIMLKLRYSK